MSDIAELERKLGMMEQALGESRQKHHEAQNEIRRLEESAKAQVNESFNTTTAQSTATPVYITSRNLVKFRDRPRATSDLTAHEWIADMRAHLNRQGLSEVQGAAVVLEHLSGRARLEIQGRGVSVTSSPDNIFSVLSKVFGDGDSLGQLMSQFYGYRQKLGDDLLTTSLELLLLFQRMCDLDSSLSVDQDKLLKQRLAEAVIDEGLMRELRRLNVEQPELTYFEARDRVIEWFGQTQVSKTSVVSRPKGATTQEVPSVVDPVVQMLQSQGELLKTLTEEFKLLKQERSRNSNYNRNARIRVCYRCQRPGHIARDCSPAGQASREAVKPKKDEGVAESVKE
jgi:hypothetical protein